MEQTLSAQRVKENYFFSEDELIKTQQIILIIFQKN